MKAILGFLTMFENEGVDFSQFPDWKVWLCLGILVLAVGLCAGMFITGKRNKFNFIAIGIISLVLIIIVVFVNVQSSDDYYGNTQISKENSIGTVTLEINCNTIAGKEAHIPEDGVILDATEIQIFEGDTIRDVLIRAAKNNKIVVDDEDGYIKAISGICNGDFGELSGWFYFVNNESIWISSDEYVLKDGDIIEWKYTCQMGEDLE